MGSFSSYKASTARILLVEDDRMVRMAMAAVLGELGYTVEAVPSGELGLSQYARAQQLGDPFDVVVLDGHLGGALGGISTLRLLRSINADVRAVLLSGDPNAQRDAHRNGFAAVLAKPVPTQALDDALHAAIGGSTP